MNQGFVSILFVILVVIIIFLGFTVNDHTKKTVNVIENYQAQLKKAAKLIIQSTTQRHTMIGYDHAKESEILFNQIVQYFGSEHEAEKVLKLQKGRMRLLRQEIDSQLLYVTNRITEKLISHEPALDFDLNELAGLRSVKKVSRKDERRKSRRNR